jgi:hypothetical protein
MELDCHTVLSFVVLRDGKAVAAAPLGNFSGLVEAGGFTETHFVPEPATWWRLLSALPVVALAKLRRKSDLPEKRR